MTPDCLAGFSSLIVLNVEVCIVSDCPMIRALSVSFIIIIKYDTVFESRGFEKVKIFLRNFKKHLQKQRRCVIILFACAKRARKFIDIRASARHFKAAKETPGRV